MSERSARTGAATALFGAMALGALVAVAIAWASIHKTPGLEGWLTGIFAGLFLGLLVTGAGAWAVMLLVLRPARHATEQAEGTPIDDELGAVLAELEIARLRTTRQINAGAVWRVPLAMLAAVGLWLASQYGDDPADIGDLLMFLAAAAIGGYAWAAWKLGEAYRRLYKERVLPRLAAGFGKLAWPGPAAAG